MRVLVTGATGFLGRHCLPLLESSFEDVHATSRQAIHVESGSVKWHKVDFLVNEQVENLIESVRPTHLLHLAWCTEHGKYWS
ncbi:MAG: NAD-dependent epimerase/dehydratase family protein, partial [Candidatus Obscuribacterales bacterium]|nr:NAD-dependent epimerase/dehydratase family protein [Candidatus Obscuribacterales bacterium]